MISSAIYLFFKVLYFILLFYCLCTWIPNINWYKEPFLTAKTVAEFIFAPFRKIIPPIGMLDISPIIAFIALALVEQLILRVLLSLGL